MQNVLIRQEQVTSFKKRVTHTSTPNNQKPLTFINAERIQKKIRVSQQSDIVAEVDTFNDSSGDGDTV